MRYDADCLALAIHSLFDNPIINNPLYAERLAQTIQDTIEDFISDAVEEETKRLAEPPYDTLEEKEGLI